MNRLSLYISFLLMASLGYGQEQDFSVKPIQENTEYSDFGLSFYGPSTAVFASSRRGNTIVKRVWSGNKQPYLELYKGNITTEGEIVAIENFSARINTKYHESNAVFTKDLKTVYFTGDNLKGNRIVRSKSGVVNLQLYTAAVDENGQWSNIQKLPFNSDEFNTGHPALNADESQLYFISDRPESLGATDVFVVAINADGTFGTIKNMGPNVNTTGKELFPFIDHRNILYFSSDGFSGKGGLDIYATKVDQNGGTVEALHLDEPVNSSSDDFGLVFGAGNNTGYFSSNRTGGMGDDDIYFFTENRPLQFDCNEFLKGEVREFGSEKELVGAWIELHNEKGEILQKLQTNSEGGFEFVLNCNTAHEIVVGKEDYKTVKLAIPTTDQHQRIIDQLIYLTLEEFVAVGEQLMVDIKPIYFDLDKHEIRDDAARELDKVVKTMLKYPNLKIELGSHTDSRARDQYNLNLSNRRAQATKQWIVDRGIDASRITGKGYGESKLVNGCKNGVKCTEAEHQMNRRTEFVIINPEVLRK